MYTLAKVTLGLALLTVTGCGSAANAKSNVTPMVDKPSDTSVPLTVTSFPSPTPVPPTLPTSKAIVYHSVDLAPGFTVANLYVAPNSPVVLKALVQGDLVQLTGKVESGYRAAIYQGVTGWLVIR